MTMLEQKLSALELANFIRVEIAWVKRELAVLTPASGCEAAAEHLDELDGPLGSCRVIQFLTAIRGVGPSKASMLCRRADVLKSRRLRELSDRQVNALRHELLVQANRFEKSRKDRRR